LPFSPLSSAWRKKVCGLPAFDLGPCGGRLYSACVETLKVGLVFGHRTTAGSAGAFVGTAAARLSASSASAADDDVSGGAVVLEVAAGSAAEGAGVRAGDRLHRIQANDVPLKTMSTFAFHTVGKEDLLSKFPARTRPRPSLTLEPVYLTYNGELGENIVWSREP
jgi:hypothetical protein